MKISNSMPRINFEGIKDESIRSVPPTPVTYPIHMPLFFTFAEKGTTDGYPTVGSGLVQMYGDEIATKTSKYATHVTPYIELCQKNANDMLVKRIIPDDAPPPSRIRLCLEVEKDGAINEYARDEFGNVQYDILQQPVVIGTRKGIKLRWLTLQDAMKGTLVEDTAPVSGESLRNAFGLISALASTTETNENNLNSSKEIALTIISNSEEVSELVREPYRTKINNATSISNIKEVLTEFGDDIFYRANIFMNLNQLAYLDEVRNDVESISNLVRSSDLDTIKTIVSLQIDSCFNKASSIYNAYYTSYRNSIKSYKEMVNDISNTLIQMVGIKDWKTDSDLRNNEIFKKYFGSDVPADKKDVISTIDKFQLYLNSLNIGVDPISTNANDDIIVKVYNYFIVLIDELSNGNINNTLQSRLADDAPVIEGIFSNQNEEKAFVKKINNMLNDALGLVQMIETTQSEIAMKLINISDIALKELKKKCSSVITNKILPLGGALNDTLILGMNNIMESIETIRTQIDEYGPLTDGGDMDGVTNPLEYANMMLSSASRYIFNARNWHEGFNPTTSEANALTNEKYLNATGGIYIDIEYIVNSISKDRISSLTQNIVSFLPNGLIRTFCVNSLNTAFVDNNDPTGICTKAYTYIDKIMSEDITDDDRVTLKSVVKSAVDVATIIQSRVNEVVPFEDEEVIDNGNNTDEIPIKPTRPVTDAEIYRVLMSDIASLKPFTGVNTKSKIYPIFDLEVTWRGMYGNNCGIGMFATNQDNDLIKEMGTHTYSFTVWNRESKFATPIKVRSIYSAESFKFTFNPYARDPISSAVYDLQQVMLNQYRDLNTSGGQEPVYGDFNDLHVYSENIELIQKLIYASESAENSEVAAYADKVEHPEYIINIVDGRDLNRNPYHTFEVVSMVNDPSSNAIDWSESTRIFAAGGGDGTINDETYDTLVRRELDHFGELDVMFEDMAQYPFSDFYDTGFSATTKKSIYKILTKRPDVSVTLSVFDGKVRRDLNEIFSIATMLNSVGANYVESETYGTPLTRAVLVAQTGELIGDNSYTKPISVAYELMNMRSSYMGNPEGNLRTGFEYDEAPGNRAKLLKNITNPSMLATTRSMLWSKNVTYFQYCGRDVLFCPAVQTMYSNETSVLRSDINMKICCDLNKIAFKVWTELTGRTISNTKLCDLSNRRITEIASSKYGSRVIITPDTFITPLDNARGWSWTTHIHAQLANMKTVNDLTIISHRLTEDE